jgi:5-methylcytosine-specific restriction protein A
MYLAAHPVCERPDCAEASTDVDHKVRRRDGGTDEWTNLQALCHPHHSVKTAQRDGAFGNPLR